MVAKVRFFAKPILLLETGCHLYLTYELRFFYYYYYFKSWLIDTGHTWLRRHFNKPNPNNGTCHLFYKQATVTIHLH